MEKNSSKKGDIKISLLGLLIGISLIVAGVYGIVSNKIENQEYKNSTDIRTVTMESRFSIITVFALIDFS